MGKIKKHAIRKFIQLPMASALGLDGKRIQIRNSMALAILRNSLGNG
jgi:hypothetical protein